MDGVRPLKRVAIKEEVSRLSIDVKTAVILDLFFHESERMNHDDEYVREEFEPAQKCWRYGDTESVEPKCRDGWSRITLDAVVEESMVEGNRSRMIRDIISHLIQQGWREHRQHLWLQSDKKHEHRVPVEPIAGEWQRVGYAVDDYTMPAIPAKKGGDQ